MLVAHDNALLHRRLASRCPTPSPERVEAVVSHPRWGEGAAVADLHARLRDDLGYGGGWDAFRDDWCCHFALDASMLALVGRLAAAHRVILFSNTNAEHWTYLVAASGGALAGFEHFLSYEMRLSKPAVESFDLVARQAGIAPARSIFFDDLPANVAGARRAGFRAEVFAGEAGLRDHLARAGVALPP